MTSVSTPNTGALPRRRVFQPGSFGAIALVVAVGAAIAGGIVVTNDEAVPAAATVTPSANTFTKQREASVINPTTANTVTVESADRAHLNRAPAATIDSAVRPNSEGGPGSIRVE